MCRVCYFTIKPKMTANEAREGPKCTREDVGFILFLSGPPSRIVFSQNWPTSFTDCSQPCAGLDSELRVPGTERHIPGPTQPVLWVTSMFPYSSRPRQDRLRFTEPGRRGQGSYRGTDPPHAASHAVLTGRAGQPLPWWRRSQHRGPTDSDVNQLNVNSRWFSSPGQRLAGGSLEADPACAEDPGCCSDCGHSGRAGVQRLQPGPARSP